MRRDVFQAIADPTRREIIKLLVKEQLTLNAIAENFDISRPAVSKHIKILKECGLVSIRQEGRERYCSTKTEKLKVVEEWLAYYRQFWNEKLDALGGFLENETNNNQS